MEKSIKYNVMLIEDNLEDALLIKEFLGRTNGYSFLLNHFTSINQSLDALKNNSFDVILTDLNLPDSAGLETVKKVYKSAIEIPLIVLTDINDKDAGLAALNIGAQHYLTKGNFNSSELIQSIQYAVSRKKIEDELRYNRDLLFSVFNDTPMFMSLINEKTEVVKINKSTVEITGKTEKESIGLKVGELLNCVNHLNDPLGCGFGEKCKSCNIRSTVHDAFQKKTNFQNIKTKLPLYINRNVFQKQFLCSASFIKTQKEELVLLVLNDITELEEAKINIEKSKHRLEYKLKISEYKASNTTDLLNYCLKQTLILTESNLGYIAICNEHSKQFNIQSWLNKGIDNTDFENLQNTINQNSKYLWNECSRKQIPSFMNDPSEICNYLKKNTNDRLAIKRLLTVPVITDNNNALIISVANKESDYNQSDSNHITLLMKSAWKSIEREKLVEDLKIAKEKAEESARLKTEFLNNMSHEIRTPMNGIVGFSQILINSGLSEEKRKYYSAIIQNNCHQLLHIIDNILEISKLETKQIQTAHNKINLNELMYNVHTIFKSITKENNVSLYLKKGLSDNESTIYSDKTLLYSILNNVVGNAVKYTHEGYVETGYHVKNKQIEIYVKDTGIGIAPENLETVFLKFSREEKELSRNAGGLGLGLSIARRNAELLGGKITLESVKGEGSTFYITFPYKPVLFAGIEESKDSGTDIMIEKQKSYTILIAEDEETNYLYLEALFEDVLKINCRFLRAMNGKEAVEMCEKNKDIDFVLMDIKMPVMDGLEATQRIKAFRPGLKIIAQTAYSSYQDKEAAFNAGCDDFISKPIKTGQLSQLINKL